MSLYNITAAYATKDDQGERAIFEAAMEKRIVTEGYRMADLMYAVYQCEKKIEALEFVLAEKSCFKPKTKEKTKRAAK